jgi:pyridoxamine 5'-phosphate oxidase
LEDTLSEIFTHCWSKLLYGSIIASDAYHIGVVGTQLNAEINLRTVVLRAIDPDDKHVLFYTDIRSAKLDDINNGSNLAWLFYDAAEKVQLRLSGEAIIHHQDELAEQHWQKVHTEGRKSYRAIPGPSTGIDHPVDGLEYLNEDNHDPEAGYKNFAVIVTQVNFIEWLNLKEDGHRRAQFRLIDNNWKGQWLIP